MRQQIRFGVAATLAAGALVAGSAVYAAEIVRPTAGVVAEQGTTVAIEMGDYYFSPANPALTAGSYTFVATNVGEKRHNLIIEGNGVYKVGRDVGFGGRDSFTIDLAAGAYKLICDLGDHAERGMIGTLTVTAAPAPAPAPAPVEAPPAEAPPAEAPPAEVPPAEVPPAEAPPAEAPPSEPTVGVPPAEGAPEAGAEG